MRLGLLHNEYSDFWGDSGKSEMRKAAKEKTREMLKDLGGLKGFFRQERLEVPVMGCLT